MEKKRYHYPKKKGVERKTPERDMREKSQRGGRRITDFSFIPEGIS